MPFERTDRLLALCKRMFRLLEDPWLDIAGIATYLFKLSYFDHVNGFGCCKTPIVLCRSDR